VPVHDPLLVDTGAPTCTTPLSTGNAVFTGAVLEPPPTAAVLSETAVSDPAAFEAVTVLRMVSPRSVDVGTYDDDVAPGISRQPNPAASHRRH
jgi:hypothetical protein